MGKGVFFVGGTRSGKSWMAQKWAEGQATERLYLATCLVNDEEMAKRVVKHRKMRTNGWQCIEEGLDPVSALKNYYATKNTMYHAEVILLDCMSLWIANLLNEGYNEDSILAKVNELATFLSGSSDNKKWNTMTTPYAVVGSETGLGIVPVTPLGRIYRDINGRANQILAGTCSSVVMVSCGLPLIIKGDVPGIEKFANFE